MKKTFFAAVVLLVATASFASDDAYRFRATWTTDHFEFAGLGGTNWKWLNLGCPQDRSCEVLLDSHGANGALADLAVSRVSDQKLSMRCLRDGGCNMFVMSEKDRANFFLKPGAVADFASGSIVAFTAYKRPSSSGNH